MKKSILNLGKPLNKIEQKQVNGGTNYSCSPGDGALPRCPAICFQGNCFF